MRRVCLLLLLGMGAGVVWEKRRAKTCSCRRADLLLNKRWAWVSWTEKNGDQPPQERILSCMQANSIQFEQVQGQNLYSEACGPLTSPGAGTYSHGEWSLSRDEQQLTITGFNITFEDSWHIARLTTTELQLSHYTATSQGRFTTTMTFVRR